MLRRVDDALEGRGCERNTGQNCKQEKENKQDYQSFVVDTYKTERKVIPASGWCCRPLVLRVDVRGSQLEGAELTRRARQGHVRLFSIYHRHVYFQGCGSCSRSCFVVSLNSFLNHARERFSMISRQHR